MKVESKILIEDLEKRTHESLKKATLFMDLELKVLNWKADTESWSILECIEHLNLYGLYYLPEIENRIQQSNTQPEAIFKSGFLGNYFANALTSKPNLNKMKTKADKNPVGSQLDKRAISQFLDQQQKTLLLLKAAKKINLNKTKTGISISKWIKLKLGDTFRVLIYHNQRHLVQAQNVLENNLDLKNGKTNT